MAKWSLAVPSEKQHAVALMRDDGSALQVISLAEVFLDQQGWHAPVSMSVGRRIQLWRWRTLIS